MFRCVGARVSVWKAQFGRVSKKKRTDKERVKENACVFVKRADKQGLNANRHLVAR